MDIFNEQPKPSSNEYNPLVDVFEQQPESSEQMSYSAPVRSIDEINASLNDQQKAAAEHLEGAVLINAGAGAGKTKTMIHRVATMIYSGIPPTNIMLLTFTNKAAGEIKDRLQGMVGDHAQYICSGTFHSIVFRQILQKYPESTTLTDLGVNMEQATILDEDDSVDVMKDAMKAALDPDELKVAKDEGWTPSRILKVMNFARAHGQDRHAFRKTINPGDPDELFHQFVEKCWGDYDKGCRAVNGIDFSDILVFADKMLKQEPAIAEEVSRQFKYVIVDEAQDTNPVQYSIVKKVCTHNNLGFVGDFRQSIYRFNGAEPRVLEYFKKEFNNVKTYEIETNYRSKKLITDIANCCADFMPNKVTDGKGHMIPMRPNADQGGRFNIVEFPTDADEAKMLARAVIRDIREGKDPNEIAILYRQRSLRMKLEEELVAKKIPYRIVGDRSFFQRREVRDTVALLRYVFHPWDSLAAIRVLKNSKLGVSDNLCRKEMKESGINAHEFMLRKSEETLKGSSKPKKHAYKIKPFLALCQEIRDMVDYGDEPSEIRECLSRLWNDVLRPGVESAARAGNGNDDASMDARIGHVTHVMDRFQKDMESGLGVDEIIEDLTMMVEAESGLDRREKAKINLMTMHASKGLEWDNVYLMGLNNVALATDESQDPEDIAEGRRLFYVGITRARENLSMSFARRIFHNGSPVNTKWTGYVNEITRSMGIKPHKYTPIGSDYSR